MLISWCTLEDICVHHCEVGGFLALCCVSSYSHYCSSPLSYERRDESFWHLQPLLLRVCVCRGALNPCYPSRGVYVYCARLCSGLTFVYTKSPCWLVCCLLHVECFWRKRVGVLAAPQRCLPPGQGRLHGSVWPNRLPF